MPKVVMPFIAVPFVAWLEGFRVETWVRGGNWIPVKRTMHLDGELVRVPDAMSLKVATRFSSELAARGFRTRIVVVKAEH